MLLFRFVAVVSLRYEVSERDVVRRDAVLIDVVFLSVRPVNTEQYTSSHE